MGAVGAMGAARQYDDAVAKNESPRLQSEREIACPCCNAVLVIDLNLDTVRDLAANDVVAFYGDATRREILEAASIADAKYLLVTVPDVLVRTLVIIASRELNENIRVFARARELAG